MGGWRRPSGRWCAPRARSTGRRSASTSSTEPPEPRRLLEVGWVARPHGIRGEVVVELVSNRPERHAPGAVLYGPAGPLTVVRARPERASGGRERLVVAFAEVSGREAAEALRGAPLHAAPLEDPGALWVHELIGAEVRSAAGALLGRVAAVQANPASDLLVLDDDRLIPLRFVVAHRPGVVVVDPPAGLLDD